MGDGTCRDLKNQGHLISTDEYMGGISLLAGINRWESKAKTFSIFVRFMKTRLGSNDMLDKN